LTRPSWMSVILKNRTPSGLSTADAVTPYWIASARSLTAAHVQPSGKSSTPDDSSDFWRLAPPRECQRTADADSPHAERRDVADGESDVAGDQEVERLRADRFDQRLDFLRLERAGREEHVCARACVLL
jgi:hypothetical protein